MKNARPRILVVYQYIALYRLPVFTELANSRLYNFEFMSGTIGSGETPKLASQELLEAAPFQWRVATNHWLPFNLLWQPEVIDAVLRDEYDGYIFLGDMHYLSTWIAVVAARLSKKKTLFWTIGMHRPERALKLFTRNLWHALPHQLLVYGEYAKDLMIAAGVKGSKIVVIGNSLDYSLQTRIFETLDRRPSEPNALPVLVSIGRVTARRKLNRLIEAVAALRDDHHIRVLLRIIGDGSARGELEELVHKLELTAEVEFLGAVYGEEEIARHMHQADLCVVPGIIGLGAIHAHSYGTPVITCGDWAIQAPEAEVILPGRTGAFCRWDDSDSVTQTIKSWLASSRDRSDVRSACRAEIARKWTPARQREVIETALDQLFSPALQQHR